MLTIISCKIPHFSGTGQKKKKRSLKLISINNKYCVCVCVCLYVWIACAYTSVWNTAEYFFLKYFRRKFDHYMIFLNILIEYLNLTFQNIIEQKNILFHIKYINMHINRNIYILLNKMFWHIWSKNAYGCL